MAEISANLEQAFSQTPTVFKDRSAFDKEFAYDERSDSQKLLLDEFFNRKKNESMLNSMSAQEMINSIASGKTSIDKYAGLEAIDPAKLQAVKD